MLSENARKSQLSSSETIIFTFCSFGICYFTLSYFTLKCKCSVCTMWIVTILQPSVWILRIPPCFVLSNSTKTTLSQSTMIFIQWTFRGNVCCCPRLPMILYAINRNFTLRSVYSVVQFQNRRQLWVNKENSIPFFLVQPLGLLVSFRGYVWERWDSSATRGASHQTS